MKTLPPIPRLLAIVAIALAVPAQADEPVKTDAGVYSGDLYQTSGARFDAFNPASVTATKVGTATFTFADGNDATFDYTVQLGDMGAPVHQQKQITREVFAGSGTTCR